MKKLFYCFISATLLTSCTEKIEIELDSTYTRLVVYGAITTDTTTHTVELKKSADYFFNKPAETISGARVELTWSDTSIILPENQSKPGFYETPPNFFGRVGETYHLFIQNVDIDENGETEDYNASSYLPPVNSIDSITLKYTANSFFEGWEIQVWTYDPEDEKNFYLFKALINNRLASDTLTEIVVQNDDLFNGNYTFGITSQFLDQNKENEVVEAGDTITFEVNGITEDFYNFVAEAQIESFGQNPLFSGPPANISSNISNGALGFFTAYSVYRSEKTVPEVKEQEKF